MEGDRVIIYDFEIYKYNWMLTWLDTETRKIHTIHDNKEHMEKMYDLYKNRIWVGYGSRRYDIYIAQAILAGFDPYEMNDWIINQGKFGWEFSNLLRQFPIINYDCSVGFRSLKELEAFMGHDIKETTVPFDIDRPLTTKELEEVKVYNRHDVMETFHVFLETKETFETHVALIDEFNLPPRSISRTPQQLASEILGAHKVDRDDEFDITFVDTLELGKYEYVKDHLQNWADNIQDYDAKVLNLETEIAGIPTVVANGGLHSAINNYIGEGTYILVDVGGYYPALMIEYDLLSRNVRNKGKFKQIRDERNEMKLAGDPREEPRKLLTNITYGATKYKYSPMYDPLQGNNICFNGQLLLIDLAEKLEGNCQIIQKNTDGILIKLYKDSDKEKIMEICKEWENRTRMTLDYDYFKKIIQRDVNNYIFVEENGNVHSKGGVVKKLNPLDNDLPIVNRAVVDYFVKGISPRNTVYSSKKLIDFQKITKVSRLYEYAFHEIVGGADVHTYSVPVYRTRQGERYLSHHNEVRYEGEILQEKVIRCFASNNFGDGAIYKKHKEKEGLDKTPSTPEKCFIENGDIRNKGIPKKLDREWYVELAERRIREFVK